MKIGERYQHESFMSHEKEMYDSYVAVPENEPNVIVYTKSNSTGTLYQYSLEEEVVNILCFKCYAL